MDLLEHLVPLDHVESRDLRVALDHLDHLVSPEHPEHLDPMDSLGPLDLLDLVVLVEKPDHLANLEDLDLKDNQVCNNLNLLRTSTLIGNS